MAKKLKRSAPPSPPRGASPPKPEPPKASALPSLEEFLVAAQKSLARSMRTAQQSAKADNEFALGERPVYAIDGLDMEVSVALSIESQRVRLDFNAPGEMRSKVRFRIQSKPVELLKGAKLELADLDPLGEHCPRAHLRAWLVDDHGIPARSREIELHFVRAGEKIDKRPIIAITDAAGRVDFFVDPAENKVKIVGDRTPRTSYLRGTVGEYFVWATAKVAPEWGTIADFSAPHPPYTVHRDDTGRPLELCSEMHRLRA